MLLYMAQWKLDEQMPVSWGLSTLGTEFIKSLDNEVSNVGN